MMKQDRPQRNEQAVSSGGSDVELAVVAGLFLAKPDKVEQLGYALARYVVLSRMEDGCRNIDLVTSVTVPGLFMLWEKWESHAHQQAHMEADAMTALAEGMADLVAEPPQFDLFDAVSAHDLA
jgi:quinol monooxygenase YgiN